MEDELLTTAEVADTFRVTVHAVNQWARSGAIEAVLLPSGGPRPHRRYRRSDIERIINPPVADEPVEAAS